MNNIDKWCAEQRGVELYSSKHINECGNYFYFNDVEYDYEWTIQDPRCREMFRKWWLQQKRHRRVIFDAEHGVSYREGKTIIAQTNEGLDNSSELACITAIWEKDND